jgi:type II secretory pathway pseudopilin PulG
MKPKPRRKSGFYPTMTGVGILVFAGLAAAIYPLILKRRKAVDRTTALNNMKQIGECLVEFDKEYGNYPDNQTALDVTDATKTDFTLSGQYSNDYFRQLLVARAAKDPKGKHEEIFWCKTPQSPMKPDNDFSTPAKALAAGEVGFSYLMASQTMGQSASGEPSRAVLVAPSYQFRPDWTFDPGVFQGMAVVLRLDNSASAIQIRESDRKISIQPGRMLDDSGDCSPWGTDMNPILRAPQPK